MKEKKYNAMVRSENKHIYSNKIDGEYYEVIYVLLFPKVLSIHHFPNSETPYGIIKQCL